MKSKNLLLILLVAVFVISCGGNKKETPASESAQLTADEEARLLSAARNIFGEMPDKMPGSENDTPELIALGKKLYFDKRLSVNNTQSCNTCHDLTKKKNGVDNEEVPAGALEGTIGTRNAPTVLNAGYQFVQFWDGRAKDLAEQAKGPILNPIEMGMKSEKDVEKVLAGVPEYIKMFKKAYPNDKRPITFDNAVNAIAAFERTLISKSRFDQWIAGKQSALTMQEKKGMQTFMELNCTICHTGPFLGGNMYQYMGLIHPYKNQKDLGRYEVTGNERDKFLFKVPMLRNAAVTEPYFHDGEVPTLEEAIKVMADINLNLRQPMSDEQVNDIAAFIKSLTDVNLEKSKK